MKPISYKQVRLTGGFWKAKQDMLRKETVWAVYDRFVETGRFDAFRCDWTGAPCSVWASTPCCLCRS